LDEEGETMLKELYNISTADFSQMTPQDWATIGQRAIQAKWFIDHIKEIKEKFELLIDGEIVFREFQAWLMEKGYKGAEKIKKAKIDVAVARAKYGATVEQEDYRLTKLEEQFAAETQQENILWDNRVIAAIANKVDEVDAAIQKMQGNAEFAQKLAQWKEEETNIYKQAAYALKYGFHGLSHSSLEPSSSSQISQFNFSQSSVSPFIPSIGTSNRSSNSSLAGSGRTTAKAKDSIKVALDWSGDIAGKVKGIGSQIHRGFNKVGSFFGGKN
jgi:hypothetical protein